MGGLMAIDRLVAGHDAREDLSAAILAVLETAGKDLISKALGGRRPWARLPA
jgi:hypothetical protein